MKRKQKMSPKLRRMARREARKLKKWYMALDSNGIFDLVLAHEEEGWVCKKGECYMCLLDQAGLLIEQAIDKLLAEAEA